MKKDNMRMPFEVNRIRRRPGQSAGEHWRALMDKGLEDGLRYVVIGMLFLIFSVMQHFGVGDAAFRG